MNSYPLSAWILAIVGSTARHPVRWTADGNIITANFSIASEHDIGIAIECVLDSHWSFSAMSVNHAVRTLDVEVVTPEDVTAALTAACTERYAAWGS